MIGTVHRDQSITEALAYNRNVLIMIRERVAAATTFSTVPRPWWNAWRALRGSSSRHDLGRAALAGALAPAGASTRLLSRPPGQNPLTLVALGLMIIVIAAPLDLEQQMLFTAACMAAALLLRRYVPTACDAGDDHAQRTAQVHGGATVTFACIRSCSGMDAQAPPPGRQMRSAVQAVVRLA